MIRPCDSAITCPGSDFPITNYSSEANDADIFIGFNFGWGDQFPPPLGSDWTALRCFTICESFISQQDADLCAARAQVLCQDNHNVAHPPGGDPQGGDGNDPFGRPNMQTFQSTEQTCSVLCPDGSPFVFTVPAGMFLARNQITADRIAASYACTQATVQQLCNPAPVCAGEAFNITITAKLKSRPLTWELIDGNLPVGVNSANSLDSTQLFLSGTIVVPGNYTFTYRITDALGFFVDKMYTLSAIGITNQTPPNFTNGTPYSFQLDAIGGTPPYIFTLTAGTLPVGLTMNEDGLISGTPNDNTATNAFKITVAVSDTSSVDCFQDLTINRGCMIPALTTTFNRALGPLAYAKVADALFGIEPSAQTSVLRINPDTGAVTGTIIVPGGGAAGVVFYEDTNKRLYVGYQIPFGAAHVGIYNPVTLAPINDVTLLSAFTAAFLPEFMDFDKVRNNLWIGDAQNLVWRLNVLTLAQNTIDFQHNPPTPAMDPNNGLAYCSVSDTVVVTGTKANLHDGWCNINPVSLAVSAVVDMGTNHVGQWLVYCPDNDRVYMGAYHIGLFKVTPLTGAFTQINFGLLDTNGIVYNPDCKRIVAFTGDNTENVIAHWVNISNDAIVGTVATGQLNQWFIQVPAYDSKRKRVWFGFGTNALLKAFT